jgi:hypothetical protein
MPRRERQILPHGGVVALTPGALTVQQDLPGAGVTPPGTEELLHLQHHDDPGSCLLHDLRAAEEQERLTGGVSGDGRLRLERRGLVRGQRVGMGVVPEVGGDPIGQGDGLLQGSGPVRVHREAPLLPPRGLLTAEADLLAPHDDEVRAERAYHHAQQRRELLDEG